MKSIIIRLFSVVVKISLLSTLAQANITVTNLADSGPGSLRQAIADAAPGEVIDFSVTGTITLTSGELGIHKSLTISGPGVANLKINGNSTNRVFFINFGNTVSISGLTIANGSEVGDEGGGIYNYNSNLTLAAINLETNQADYGSAVYNKYGKLTIINSSISSNINTNYGTLWNDGGTISLVSSAVINNNSSGVVNASSGTLTCTNSTISGNIGGAISCANWTTTTIDSCTISGALDAAGLCTMRNSVLAGHNQNFRSIESLDYNLIEDTSNYNVYGLTAHNIHNQDPKLGPLADLGGPTPMHALRFDSPALDAGHSGGLTTDQRGFPRPIDSPDVANAEGGDGSDIGAYEVNPSTQMSIYTAVEVEFGTTLGRTYRVESSTDMATWSQVEAGIVGTGGPVTRLYTTKVIPKRFFQAVQE